MLYIQIYSINELQIEEQPRTSSPLCKLSRLNWWPRLGTGGVTKTILLDHSPLTLWERKPSPRNRHYYGEVWSLLKTNADPDKLHENFVLTAHTTKQSLLLSIVVSACSGAVSCLLTYRIGSSSQSVVSWLETYSRTLLAGVTLHEE